MVTTSARLYATKLPTPISTTTCSSNAASSPRTTRCTDCRLQRRHASALQHLVHVRLVVRTSNHIDTSPVNLMYFKDLDINLTTSTNISYLHRTTSCISTTLTNISYSHRASSCLSMTPTNTSYSHRTFSCRSTTSSNTSYLHQTSICFSTTLFNISCSYR